MVKNNRQALDIAKDLAEKTHAINSGGRNLAWAGTSNTEAQLLELRKSAAEVVSVIGSNQSYEQIMQSYEKLAAGIDTAGVTGLVGEAEVTGYYELIDSLWAAIEREKAPPNQ